MDKEDYNLFETQRELKEKEFIEYVNEVCGYCFICRKIFLKKDLDKQVGLFCNLCM